MTRIINEYNESYEFDKERYKKYVHRLSEGIEGIDTSNFIEKTIRNVESKDTYTTEQLNKLSVLNAIENINQFEPNWTYLAAGFALNSLYNKAAFNRRYDSSKKYGSLYDLVLTLTAEGIYDKRLIEEYTEADMKDFQEAINPENDKLFTYIGLTTLADRYLATNHNKDVYELPQERFMIVAMTHMIEEDKTKRNELVKESYWAMSNLYMTVATPTLSNAGKSYGQLSSCFIDTVEDDLRSIYDNNTDMSTVSKNGGGVGAYMGKIRSRGSDIKGFKGISSGVVPWIKQLNNTAVSVDQLGQRQGAFAVYLDVWHKDIISFLELRLNNGDERLRAHDIFTGVCIPDIFMETVKERGVWHLFDPHEVRSVMGYSIEDYYDEEKGNGSFRTKYQECIDNPILSRVEIEAIDIMKAILKSQLETGTPYMFYRDSVNRANANKDKGMIYCSNLCTEIAQNMSPTTLIKEELVDKDGKGVIITYKEAGEFVVCNLSSINLGRAVIEDVLERLIPIQVRMLDNVIDINDLPILQARYNNRKYRAIGLGTFGWHHLLALKGIQWESDKAVEYCDSLYEEIAYLTIKSSMELSKEKESYPSFIGSDWHNGNYFFDRGYESEKWLDLKDEVYKHGIRNGYLMAVAPNSSTSILAGSSASIDPIFNKEYSEEKKDYKIPVTAPDLSPKTTWFYKTAYQIDQHWSIKQNAKRAKHIDQGISFNFYVSNNIKAIELLNLHIHAWESGIKTTYYVRSTSQSEIDECESCHS